MDKKIAQMKKIFMEMGGSEAVWNHIELHIKMSVKEVKETDGKKT